MARAKLKGTVVEYNRENNDNNEKLEVGIRVYKKVEVLVSRRPTHQPSWL